MKMQKLRLSTFLGLLIYLFVPTGVVAKPLKGNVIFTRGGIVIELEERLKGTNQPDPLHPLPTLVVHEASEPPEEIFPAWIDDQRALATYDWKPQTHYHIALRWTDGSLFEISTTAPLKPLPYRIRTVELEDSLSLLANLQRPAKPTTITFSPDGEQLAIGTNAGHLAIINPLTGDRIWKTRISEGYAKHAAFSSDGKRFYIGEQSADGFIYAYDLSATKPTLLWRYRMADDIDTSTSQNPDDVYAWVQYPGPYRISTTEGGDLLVVGNHSWSKDGVGLKKAQLYRFDGETGTLKWKWPPNQTLPMTISWFDYSRDAKTVALLTYIRGSGEAGGFKSGTLYVINGETGEAAWEYTFDPLKPYFEEVTFWRGVSAAPDGGFINATTDDGRAFIFNTTPEPEGIKPLWNTNLTTPLEVSGIPIIATNGTIGATNDFALFVTGDTFIPYHLQQGAQRPPSAHPNAMTLFAYAWSGEKVWQWTLESMPQGLQVDGTGRYAVISVSKRGGNVEEQLHGVSVFDLAAKGGGLSKYLYTYRTEGQLPYDTIDISADGRFIALIEMPITMPDETIRGGNRVHIIR